MKTNNSYTVLNLAKTIESEGIENMGLDKLIRLQGLMYAKLDSGAWENTKPLQELHDLVTDWIAFVGGVKTGNIYYLKTPYELSAPATIRVTAVSVDGGYFMCKELDGANPISLITNSYSTVKQLTNLPEWF